MITEDFVALTSANLHNSGVVLEDRSTREHLRVHSLLELEMGRIYVSPRGNSLRRVSQTHVLLAEKVPLAVDLVQDTPGSPGSPGRPLRFVLPGEGTDLSAPLSLGASLSEQGPAWACASPATTQDGLDSADTTSALTYLRMLSAEPDAAKLRSLHEVRHEHTPRTLLSLLPCPSPLPCMHMHMHMHLLQLPYLPGARQPATIQQLVRLLPRPGWRTGTARCTLALAGTVQAHGSCAVHGKARSTVHCSRCPPPRRYGRRTLTLAMADTGDAPGGGGRGAGAVCLLHHGPHQAQAGHGGRAGAAPRGHLPARCSQLEGGG
eukprot:scaffold88601_cov57-Phaeocystis_antarctica.AAC.3